MQVEFVFDGGVSWALDQPTTKEAVGNQSAPNLQPLMGKTFSGSWHMGVAAVKAQRVSGYRCWLHFFSTYICRKRDYNARDKRRLCQAAIEKENYLWHNTICIACMTVIWCSGELCLWIIMEVLAMLVVTLSGESNKGHFVSCSYLW